MKGVLFTLLVVIGLTTSAQEADSIITSAMDTATMYRELETITIVTSTCSYVPPISHYLSNDLASVPMRMYSSKRLSDILTDITTIHIKAYQPGGLATPSFRGTNASHTRLFWNDVPLSSPSNGVFDFSLVPLGLFSNIGFATGSGSLENGSGALGGEINISQNEFRKGTNVELTHESGSFNTHHSSLKLGFGNEKVRSRTGFLYSTSDNDFTFINTALADQPEVQQQSAALNQLAGSQDIQARVGKKQITRLQYNGWVSYTDRDLPPTMLTVDNNEEMQDLVIANRVAANYRQGMSELNILSSHVYHLNAYDNEALMLQSDNITNTQYNKATIRLRGLFRNHDVLAITLDNSNQWGQTDNFDEQQFRVVNGLHALMGFRFNRVNFSASLRQELVDDQLSPFLPGFELTFHDRRRIFVTAGVNRNYRMPTFNDWYWSPGGNPDLENETSWNSELGFTWFSRKFNNHEFILKAKGYYIIADNWIQWMPTEFSYWSPQNVKKVQSAGLEADVQYLYEKGRWHVHFKSKYHFNQATNKETFNSNDASEGKLLIYTPQHQGQLALEIRWKGTYFEYNHQFTGNRFITTDNSSSLDAFSTGNLWLGHQFSAGSKQQNRWEVYLRLENIWDIAYQNVAWRPMPGRAVYGGIKYNFGKASTAEPIASTK